MHQVSLALMPQINSQDFSGKIVFTRKFKKRLGFYTEIGTLT